MSMKMFDIILMIAVLGALTFSFMTYRKVSGSENSSSDSSDSDDSDD